MTCTPRTNEKGEPVRPERAREDDEQEPDGQDKGQGDDGLEAGGWHTGRKLGVFFSLEEE